jgi:hypothetical protein
MKMMELTSIIVSGIALVVSVATFWLTRYRRGSVRMTRPTTIFFGPDGQGSSHPKIFIRALLYSTSDRGQYIENLFVRLTGGNTVRDFDIWVYGHQKELVRGSGLFVDRHGIAVNHHFLMAETSFIFTAGSYLIELYSKPVGEPVQIIYRQELSINKEEAQQMRAKRGGIYYDWVPSREEYATYIDKAVLEPS